MSQFYEDICNMFIRPTRQTYNFYDLGPPIINKNGRRKDFEIQSHHRFKIKCSFYENINLIGSYRNKTCFQWFSPLMYAILKSKAIRFCRKLIENGYHACAFDFAGSGNSEGDYVTLGHQEKYDIWEVVKYLNTNFNIEYIVLWGRSMGASSIITFYNYFEQMKRKPLNSSNNIRQKIFSNIYNIKILSIVLDSPFCSLSRLAIQIAQKKFIVPEIIIKVVLSMMNKTMEKKANLSVDELQLINKLQVVTCPVLLIASQQDTLIDFRHSEEIFKKINSQEKQLVFIKGDHHEYRSEQTIKNILHFIQKHRKHQKISIKQVITKQTNDLTANKKKISQNIQDYIPRKLSSKSYSKNKTDRLKIIGNSLQTYHHMEKHIQQSLCESKQLNHILQQKTKEKTLITNTVDFFPATEANHKHTRQSSDGVSYPAQVNYKKNTSQVPNNYHNMPYENNYNSTPYENRNYQHNHHNYSNTQYETKNQNYIFATPPPGFKILQKQKNQSKAYSKLQSLKTRKQHCQKMEINNIKDQSHNTPHSQRFIASKDHVIPKTDTNRYRISSNSREQQQQKIIENKNRLTSKNKLPNLQDNIVQQTPKNHQMCTSNVNQIVLQRQKQIHLLNHQNYNIIQEKLKRKKKDRLTLFQLPFQPPKVQSETPIANIIFKNHEPRHYQSNEQHFKNNYENQPKYKDTSHKQQLCAYPQPITIQPQQHYNIQKGQEKNRCQIFLGSQSEYQNKKQIAFIPNNYSQSVKRYDNEVKRDYLFKSTANCMNYNNFHQNEDDQQFYPQIRRLNTETIIDKEQGKQFKAEGFPSMKFIKNNSRQLQRYPNKLGQKSKRQQGKVVETERKCIFLKSPHKKQRL